MTAVPDPIVDDPDWRDQANCLGLDPALFFTGRGASTREAKQVCARCVVRDECLEYALANGEKFGIWGGLSERERRRIRRQRARRQPAIVTGTPVDLPPPSCRKCGYDLPPTTRPGAPRYCEDCRPSATCQECGATIGGTAGRLCWRCRRDQKAVS